MTDKICIKFVFRRSEPRRPNPLATAERDFRYFFCHVS